MPLTHERPAGGPAAVDLMIGDLTGRPVEERLAGSISAAVLLRVHDVAATHDALAVPAAVERPREERP